MILKQIQLIGKTFLNNKSNLEVLIEQQKKYNSPNLHVIEVDPEINTGLDCTIRNEEYNSNKEMHYLTGIVGSVESTCFSLVKVNTKIESNLMVLISNILLNNNKLY